MSQSEIWTATKLVHWIANDLEKRALSPPHRLEAELIVAEALSISRLDIYLNHDKPCTETERASVRELYKRRIKGEPVAYILGKSDFWTLDLQVGTGVLIPRQDTETLVETAVNLVPNQGEEAGIFSILELGTGSGTIPLALCHELNNLSIITTDISLPAMRYALTNFNRYPQLFTERNNQVLPIICNRFDAISPQKQFDMIISNPPYVRSDEMKTLQIEVKDWEPNLALEAANNGLIFYQYFNEVAQDYLKPGGYLIFEHGYEQLKPIKEIFNSNNKLEFFANHQDLGKRDRVMVYRSLGY